MEHLSEHHQDLLIGKMAGTLSAEEAGELEKLLQENGEVRKAYQQLLGAFPPNLSFNSFEELDRPDYWRDLKSEVRHQAPSKTGSRLRSGLAAAAAIIGLVLTGWYIWPTAPAEPPARAVAEADAPFIQLQMADGRVVNLSTETGSIQQGSTTLTNHQNTLHYTVSGNEGPGINSLKVPVGMDYKVLLSDGSEIWLNSVTQLDFPFQFSGDTREISISGEAYCSITKDPKKPFILHLPNGSVKVLGTEFNVNSYDSGVIKVALVRGSVDMKAGSHSRELTPGLQGVYHSSSNTPISTHPFNARKVLGWRDGLLYYDDAALDEIGPVLSRWFGVRVQIDNPALLKKRFAGVLDRHQPLQVFLDDLKGMARINSTLDKSGVLHFE